MPLGITLIWPALHLMLGVGECRLLHIPRMRRYSGTFLLLISLALCSQPYGVEQGFFYWLFSACGAAMLFTQLRIWHPLIVSGLTLASIAMGIYLFIQ